MTALSSEKLTIPEVLRDFADYYEKNDMWGSLHIVLDDGNVADSHVEFCRQWAIDNGDKEGERLANLLNRMSRTQRLKLPHSVRKAIELRTPKTATYLVISSANQMDVVNEEDSQYGH